jgi:hypothetical protein
MQQLEQVNFGDCLVRSKGALAIAEALSEGHSKLRVSGFDYRKCQLCETCAPNQ